MFCFACGKKIVSKAKFCRHCGAKASSVQPTLPLQSAPPQIRSLTTAQKFVSGSIGILIFGVALVFIYYIIMSPVQNTFNQTPTVGKTVSRDGSYPITSTMNCEFPNAVSMFPPFSKSLTVSGNKLIDQGSSYDIDSSGNTRIVTSAGEEGVNATLTQTFSFSNNNNRAYVEGSRRISGSSSPFEGQTVNFNCSGSFSGYRN